MPAVLRDGAFSLRFYANDHAPAHVHCVCPDGVVVVQLLPCAVLRIEGGVNERDLRRALCLVRDHSEHLLAAWNEFDLRRKMRC